MVSFAGSSSSVPALATIHQTLQDDLLQTLFEFVDYSMRMMGLLHRSLHRMLLKKNRRHPFL